MTEPQTLPSRKPTDKDVEIARISARLQLWSSALKSLGIAVVVVASAAPVWAMTRMVEALAGKQTIVNVSVLLGVSLTLHVPAAVVTAIALHKNSKQGKELVRTRERLQELEKQNAESRKMGKRS